MSTPTVSPRTVHDAKIDQGVAEPIDRLAADAAALRSEAESVSHRLDEAPHVPARPSDPPHDDDPSADELHKAALRRMESSRAALRAVLVPPGRRTSSSSEPLRASSHRARATARPFVGSPFTASVRDLTTRLREGNIGVALGTAFGFLRAWWRAQPFHATGEMLALAAKTELQPVARRHPWKFVGSAALAGGLFVMLKPWRWAPVAATTRPLVGVATRWSLGQLASPALQLAAAGMLSAWIRQRMQLHEGEEEARLRAERMNRPL